MKRALICGLAVLLVAAASVGVAQAPRPNGEKARIEGTWLSVVKMGDAPFIQFLTTFTGDGRTTILLPFGPDVFYGTPNEPTANPGDPRIGCTGEWRHASRKTFDVTMYCLWRQNPGVEPDRIRYRLTLDESGNRLAGPFKYYYADPAFPPGAFGQEFEFTLESVRLGLVPLD